jgi:hypothetical protein
MGWLLHRGNVVGSGGSRVKKMERGNDECPICRQLMWDINTYQQAEADLRATWNQPEE